MAEEMAGQHDIRQNEIDECGLKRPQLLVRSRIWSYGAGQEIVGEKLEGVRLLEEHRRWFGVSDAL